MGTICGVLARYCAQEFRTTSIGCPEPADDVIFDPRRNRSPKSGANHARRLITRRDGGRRCAPSYHGYRGSLPTPCQALVESTSELHPFVAGAVDATMSRMCQLAARRS